ncbi:hypothetical protein PUN28_003511 [Cardiocondyla obscurior]|uniref:Uncharacterized protein n=1 Tax=Cardiocondyla obscurior TaxID=286306 RepID=A0AAW2GJA5_9HYME
MATGTTPDQHILARRDLRGALEPRRPISSRRRVSVCAPRSRPAIVATRRRSYSHRRNARPGPQIEIQNGSFSLSLFLSPARRHDHPGEYVFSVPHHACPSLSLAPPLPAPPSMPARLTGKGGLTMKNKRVRPDSSGLRNPRYLDCDTGSPHGR